MHFHEGWFIPPEVDPHHEWIKLTHAIDWERLTETISPFYSKTMGRPTKPARAKIGLLILKHRYQLSDEEVVDQLKFLQDLSFDNKSDQSWLSTSLNLYKEPFGHLSSQLALDRGFFSRDNKKLAKTSGISKIAIQHKGKSPPGKPPPFTERLRRLRCAIEAKISLSKRSFGLDRLRYRIQGGEEIWIRMGLLAMNWKHALNSS